MLRAAKGDRSLPQVFATPTRELPSTAAATSPAPDSSQDPGVCCDGAVEADLRWLRLVFGLESG